MKSFQHGMLSLVLPLALATVVVMLALSPIHKGGEATLLLADTAGLAALSTLDTRPRAGREAIDYRIGEQQYQADLYRTRETPLAGIVMVHGAVELGRNDPRLIPFATTMARSGFAVLVPDLPAMREFRITADEVRIVVDAVRHLDSSGDLLPGGRIGLVAFSVAAGLAVLAALEPEIRDRVQFVLTVGGYYDLPQALIYSTTGYYRQDGEWRYQKQNEYGKWLFILSNIQRLESERDQRLLGIIVERKLYSADADVSDLTPRLGPQGRDVYHYLSNEDPERSLELMARMPKTIRDDLQALNLADKDLTQLKARLLLVHGVDDNIIPYTESLALAAAMPQDQAELFIVKGLFHVETDVGPLDALRLWQAFHTLLGERDGRR